MSFSPYMDTNTPFSQILNRPSESCTAHDMIQANSKDSGAVMFIYESSNRHFSNIDRLSNHSATAHHS